MIKYVQHDGNFIAYRVRGTGPLDLLHMSGAVVSIDAMDDEPHVARWHRCLASIGRLIEFDPPGLGFSDAVPGELTLDSIVDSARAVLDALDIQRVAVIGVNSGGAYAVVMAATMAERVSSLVLVNTAARVIEADDYPMGYPRKVAETYLEHSGSPGIDWSTRSADGYALMNPSLKDDPLFRRWAEQAVRQCASPAAVGRYQRLAALADVRPLLSAVHVPTLVLARHEDVFMPAAHGRYLAEHIADAQLVEVPGRDHAPWSSDSDTLVNHITEFLIGRRGSSGERVLTTLLFTDIVGSTVMAAALGDRAWHALLDNYDSVVRAQIGRYGGSEVNTTGDGFLATFDSPTHALGAGHEIVTRAAEADLAVRVGIHSGECERRGDDLAGVTVHIAARVAGCAGPGEVLVSRTVRDLLAGTDLRFSDRGQYPLKGVPEAWQLFALEP